MEGLEMTIAFIGIGGVIAAFALGYFLGYEDGAEDKLFGSLHD